MMVNEKRLIDANALMETIEGVNWYHIDKLGYLANGANSQDHTPIYKAEDIYNAIRNAPTVEAVPVVHGHWEDGYGMRNGIVVYDSIDCSVCEEVFKIESHDREYWKGRFKFCPFCGAQMDGGKET